MSPWPFGTSAAGVVSVRHFLPVLLLTVAHAATTPTSASSPITPLARANTKWSVTIHAASRDAQGNLYVTGSRLIENVHGFLFLPPYSLFSLVSPQSFHSVYVAKFDTAGDLIYEITIGGTGNDDGLGIAADAEGNAYVVGSTNSPDFPQKNSLEGPGSSATNFGFFKTGFVLKLDGTGNVLWSTYFGGAGQNELGNYAAAVAVDTASNAYVTGLTTSPSLLVTPGAFQTSGVVTSAISPHFGAFVSKFTASGTLAYSTYLGSTGLGCTGGSSCLGAVAVTMGTAIAVDSSGEAFVAGATNEADFPGTAEPISWSGGPHQTIPFLAKLKSDGSGIVFGAYLHDPVVMANEMSSVATALALDPDGTAYVGGSSNDGLFPIIPGVLGPAPPASATPPSLVKVSPDGSVLFSTVLASSGADTVSALAVAPSGDLYVSGTTRSPDFPTTADLFANGYNFVTELDPLVAKIVNAVRLPGSATDAALLLMPDQSLIAAGSSGLLSKLDLAASAPFTTVLIGAGNAALPGLGGGIAGAVVSIYGLNIGPSTPLVADVSSGQLPLTLGGVTVTLNGRPYQSPQPAALLYVSANQINAVLPYNEGTAQITVTNGAATFGPLQVALQQNDPEIFRNPDGSAIAVNPDGMLNSPSNPAPKDSIVAVFGTGIPVLFTDPGEITAPDCVTAKVDPGITVSGTPPLYFGCSPGSSRAVFQINFPLSDCGGLSCVVTYNGTPGQPFTIYTK